MAQQKLKVKTLEATIFLKILSVKIILKLKSWAQNSVIWNHRDSNSIHDDPNHASLKKLNPPNSTNIGSTIINTVFIP